MLTVTGVASRAAARPGDDEVYVASKPSPLTDPSDVNTTNSWPLGDMTVTGDSFVPVTVSSNGADNDVPPYTLTKS